jgi:hypothetical protein
MFIEKPFVSVQMVRMAKAEIAPLKTINAMKIMVLALTMVLLCPADYDGRKQLLRRTDIRNK